MRPDLHLSLELWTAQQPGDTRGSWEGREEDLGRFSGGSHVRALLTVLRTCVLAGPAGEPR